MECWSSRKAKNKCKNCNFSLGEGQTLKVKACDPQDLDLQGHCLDPCGQGRNFVALRPGEGQTSLEIYHDIIFYCRSELLTMQDKVVVFLTELDAPRANAR